MDIGAAVFLIIQKMFDNLFPRPKLCTNDSPLFKQQTVFFNCDRVGKYVFFAVLALEHKMFVTKGLNRNLILVHDWLKKNDVRLYFDLGLMRI